MTLLLRFTTLSRKEWALVALGLVAWIAIAGAGVWFVQQLTRPRAGCGTQIEGRTIQAQGAATSPRNAFQVLSGQGRCR